MFSQLCQLLSRHADAHIGNGKLNPVASVTLRTRRATSPSFVNLQDDPSRRTFAASRGMSDLPAPERAQQNHRDQQEGEQEQADYRAVGNVPRQYADQGACRQGVILRPA